MSITSQRINRLAEKFGLKTYLEIGVFNGDTFNAVCLPSKTAVDPQFQFNTSDYEKDNVKFYEMPSDEFFYRSQLEDRVTKYDLIYIDGLHTYEQSYKDFINSIPFSHSRTIWIFDDTIPSDPWAAIPDHSLCIKYKKLNRMKHSHTWMGDVYKTIFHISKHHPEFSYVTQVDQGNPQTVLWRSREETIPALHGQCRFNGSINELDYFKMLEMLNVLHPVEDCEIENFVYSSSFGSRKEFSSMNIIKPIQIL